MSRLALCVVAVLSASVPVTVRASTPALNGTGAAVEHVVAARPVVPAVIQPDEGASVRLPSLANGPLQGLKDLVLFAGAGMLVVGGIVAVLSGIVAVPMFGVAAERYIGGDSTMATALLAGGSIPVVVFVISAAVAVVGAGLVVFWVLKDVLGIIPSFGPACL